MATSSLVIGIVSSVFCIMPFFKGQLSLLVFEINDAYLYVPFAYIGILLGIIGIFLGIKGIKENKSAGFTLSLISTILSLISLFILKTL